MLSSDEEADVTVKHSAEDDISNGTSGQLAFTVEVEADEQGGDAKVSRIDLPFEITPKSGSSEDDLYDIIEGVTIEVDGNEVAQINSDNKNDWRDLTNGNKEGTLRISGIDYVVKSDEKIEFNVLLDIADLDETDDLDLKITLGNPEVRYSDGTGAITDQSSSSGDKSIDVEALDAIEFDLDEGSSNPNSVTVSFNEDRDDVLVLSNEGTVDGQDGTVDTVTVEFTFSSATTGDTTDLVDEVYFNGQKSDDISNSISSNKFTASFDMDEWDVEVDDTFDAEITVDFVEGGSFVGKSLSVTKITFEGEGADGEDFSADETPDSAPTVTLTGGSLVLADSDVTITKLNANEAKIVFELDLENEGDNDIALGADGTVAEARNGFAFTATPTGTSFDADGTTGFAVTAKKGSETLTTSNIIVKDGKSSTYIVTIFIDAHALTTSGEYEIKLVDIDWLDLGEDNAVGGSGDNADTTGTLTLNLESGDTDYLSQNI